MLVRLQTLAVFIFALLLGYGISSGLAQALRTGVITSQRSLIDPITLMDRPLAFIFVFGLLSIGLYYAITHLSSQRFWQIFFALGASAGLIVTLYYTAIWFVSDWVAVFAAVIGTIFILGVRAKTKFIWLHNLVIIIAVVGVAQIFAQQFEPKAAAIILAVLAFYDIIAVQYSRYMMTVTHTLFKREAFFGLILPPLFTDWRLSYDKVSKAAILGGGDIAFSVLFALSHLFYYGAKHFLVISLSVLVGVALMMYLEQRDEDAIVPALPPIVFMIFIGHIITMVVF